MPPVFSIEYARELDANDSLRLFRERFYAPTLHGKRAIYFLGNSLGLQPKNTQPELLKVMEGWANLGVEGFFLGAEPWLQYHERVAPMLAGIVGAKTSEIVIMNHLSVNLHLLMISFYRPTPSRYKIICEAKAFPSDQYIFQSQVRLHQLDPDSTIVEVHPGEGGEVIATADIVAAIHEHGESVALVLFSGINYYTGQSFDVPAITAAAHEVGAYAGFDLAHAAGNIRLELHNWNVDFAAWCSYKYLNSGPGAIGGAFIHERYLDDEKLPRLEGWWGNNPSNRFQMEKRFTPSTTAESWSLSTFPVLLLAAHKASLALFEEAGFDNLLAKSAALTSYLFSALDHINPGGKKFRILTPRGAGQHGCQVSIAVYAQARRVFEMLAPLGIYADWREPDVIRVAPVPLYNSFEEVFIFADVLRQLVND